MKQNTKYRIRHYVSGTFSLFFKLCMIVIFLFPFYWLITTSFKTYGEAIQFPPTLIPKVFSVESYKTVFSKIDLWNYFKNSVIVTLSVIAIQTVIGVPAAYAFARYNFKGSKVLFSLVMVAFMIPTQLTFITVYIMMSKIGWLNTLLPQILPFAANAYGIFMMRQNFKQIPDEIIEAARLDNTSEFRIMTRIMLPSAKSTLLTVTLFSFVGSWNSYFWPLVMSNSEKVRPLTLAIERLKDQDAGINWPVIMAGNVIMVLPVLILFIFMSKQILSAMGYKGVK